MYEELLIGLRGHAKRYGCDDRCPCYDAEDRGYTTCSEELAEKAADAIEKLIEVIQNHDFLESLIKPRWSPVTERLPEERKWVLCRCEASIIEVLRWENNEWYHDPQHQYMSGFITHWMSLPEPPKEET